MKAIGYAVAIENQTILVATVSPTRRAALVNWLSLNVGLTPNWATDEQIERSWVQHGPLHHAALITVDIIGR